MPPEAAAEFMSRATPPAADPPGLVAAAGDLNACVKRINDLLAQAESARDPGVAALTRELLQNVLQLHGIGLARMLEVVAECDAGGQRSREPLLADRVVRGLLLLHDLHPAPLEQRMQQALAKVLPYIRSHGGDVELVSLVDGTAQLRLEGTCKSCSASSVTLELAVRAAIEEFCPDLAGFEVIGAENNQVPPPAPCVEPAAGRA